MLPGLEVANFDSLDRSTWEIFRRDSAASQREARLYCKSSPLDEIGFPKVMKVCLASCLRISGTGSRTGGRAGPGGGGRSAAPHSARAPPAGTACSSRSCAPRSDVGLWSGEGSCQWRSSIFKYFDMPVVSCLEERKLRAVRTRPRAPQPPRRARRLAPRHWQLFLPRRHRSSLLWVNTAIIISLAFTVYSPMASLLLLQKVQKCR